MQYQGPLGEQTAEVGMYLTCKDGVRPSYTTASIPHKLGAKQDEEYREARRLQTITRS